MSILSQPITLQSIFGTDRKVGTITVNVVLTETTNDTLTITKQPIQQGASIADHAYKEPTSLTMTALFQDNNLASILTPFSSSGLSKIYQDLLDLQNSRVPFSVITLKRIYTNMLMTTLICTTDKFTENILSVSMSMQQVIIVSVSTTTVRAQLQNPGRNGQTQNAGRKSSALQTLFGRTP